MNPLRGRRLAAFLPEPGCPRKLTEREGSRVAIVLFEEVRVFHRPYPSPKTDKGAVVSVKKWLEQHGVKP
jgi:hypothetical protein